MQMQTMLSIRQTSSSETTAPNAAHPVGSPKHSKQVVVSTSAQAKKTMSPVTQGNTVTKLNDSMNKTKERFRRLPHTQAKGGGTSGGGSQQAHGHNISVLNGQHIDVSSDIYKIYIQDSQAAQNRLEMHKTLSLIQIQQISRTAHKDNSSQKFQSTRQSPQRPLLNQGIQNDSNQAGNTQQPKIGSNSQKATDFTTSGGGGILSQLSITPKLHQHHTNTTTAANNSSKMASQLQQNQTNQQDASTNHAVAKIPTGSHQRNQTGKGSVSLFAGLASATTAQSNYPTRLNSNKIGAIESYSACYGASSSSSKPLQQAPFHQQRNSKKKPKNSRISVQGIAGYDVYLKDTISPISHLIGGSHHELVSSDGGYQGVKKSLKSHQDVDKFKEQPFSTKQLVNNQSPSMAKSKKRRAPSGVHKVKLIGEKAVKHAMEVATSRNEMLLMPKTKSITPSKTTTHSNDNFKNKHDFNETDDNNDERYESNSCIYETTFQMEKRPYLGYRAQLVETSKIASDSTQVQKNMPTQLPNSSYARNNRKRQQQLTKIPDLQPLTQSVDDQILPTQSVISETEQIQSIRIATCESSQVVTSDRGGKQIPLILSEITCEPQPIISPYQQEDRKLLDQSLATQNHSEALAEEGLIVATGQRGTSSQGRITRIKVPQQSASQYKSTQQHNSQPIASKKIQTNYKKTIREQMLLDQDATNNLFDLTSQQNSRAINTEVHNFKEDVAELSPMRSYYHRHQQQPVVSLSKRNFKRGGGNQSSSKAAVASTSTSQSQGKFQRKVVNQSSSAMNSISEDEQRAFLIIEHLIEVQHNGQNLVSVDQAKNILESFFSLFNEKHPQYLKALISRDRHSITKTGEIKLAYLVVSLEEYMRSQFEKGLTANQVQQVNNNQQPYKGTKSIFTESNDGMSNQKIVSSLNIKNNTMDSTGGELETSKLVQSAINGLTSQVHSINTPKNARIVSGVGNRGMSGISNFIQNSGNQKNQPNNAALAPNKKLPLISILIQEEKIHQQHPINKCIRLINQFSIEAFLKQNQSYFMPVQKPKQKNNKSGKAKFTNTQQSFSFNTTIMSSGNFQQMSPIAANNTCANVDMGVVTSLAKQLQITLPKNGDLRSKAFICHAKEQMLTKLFDTLNKCNGVELNFKRQLFQHYRGFIGRGNNSQLFFQLFKQSRWWWNLFQAPQHDENGKVILQHGSTSTQLLREDFKEHNFIFTQWKKMMHFAVLKSLKVSVPEPTKDKDKEQKEAPVQAALLRTMSPVNPGTRGGAKDTAEIVPETNMSNQWRIYGKMEANYHLSNKFALFFHISKYYKSIERDPFDVLPQTYHITKGTTDQVYFKFIQVFKQLEDQFNQELQLKQQVSDDAALQQQTLLIHNNSAGGSNVQICARCQKAGNRSGLGHRDRDIKFETSELSLPEFGDKSGGKFRKQHSLIEAVPSRRAAARGHIMNNDRQPSQARKMSLAVKTNSTAANRNNVSPKQNETCCKCGLTIDASNVLANAQSVSSLKRRSSLNQTGCEEDGKESGFKFSKGRFSAQKFDENQQMLSQRNHSTNKRDKSIQPQVSLSHLQRQGVQFEEVAIKTTLTSQQQEFGGENKSSMSVTEISSSNVGKPSSLVDQSTRLPAIRTGKNQTAATSAATSVTEIKNSSQKQKTSVPTINGNYATSPKINFQRQSKIQGHPSLNEKISAQMTKTRLKNKQQQDHENSKKSKKQDKIMPNNIWIVKPGENSNRGNGITVCSSLREIKQILCQSDYDKQKTFIVQKYIERPALYNQRKFDIRCFGMLTLSNNKLKGFTYDNGYLRTSSRTFVADDLNNKLIHLTNDAVQKKSEEYGRYETGNKLNFGDYQYYLDANFSHLKIDFRAHIFSQMKQIMTDTFRATYKVVSPTRTLQHHTFEIFGFDFMLDENFKVYLIEVNTNPCLETNCPLLQKIITDLIDTGLRVALDPLFPPPNQQKRMNTQISVIQWQLCFDEELDAPNIEALQAKVVESRKITNNNDLTSGEAVGIEDQAVEEDLIQECEDEGEFD